MSDEPDKPSYGIPIFMAAWFLFWIFDPLQLEWLRLKPGFTTDFIYFWILFMFIRVNLTRKFWNISASEFRKKETLLKESKRLAKQVFKQSAK